MGRVVQGVGDRQSASSSSSGKRPIAFFEKKSRPSILISKTPPTDRRRLTCAEGRRLRNNSRAARARGSWPHRPQYSISIFMKVTSRIRFITPYQEKFARPGFYKCRGVPGHLIPASKLAQPWPGPSAQRAAYLRNEKSAPAGGVEIEGETTRPTLVPSDDCGRIRNLSGASI